MRSSDGTVNADTDFIATAAENAAGTTDVVLGGNAGVAAIGTEDTEANGGATLIVAQQITITSSGDDSGTTVTVEGTNADGSVISETLTAGNAAAVTTLNRFKTVTAVTMGAASAGTVDVGVEGTSVNYNYKALAAWVTLISAQRLPAAQCRHQARSQVISTTKIWP